MNIQRSIKPQIESWLFKGKIIILYGPRRVGKTTLVREIMQKYGADAKYIDCENSTNRQALEIHDEKKLRDFLGQGKLFVIDEAQRVLNIGTSLKLLVDNYPEIQIIATGSSSFDLSNRTKESLAGRTIPFTLFPISFTELSESDLITNPQTKDNILRKLLVFGSYPEIVSGKATDQKLYLHELVDGYLYKDVFEYEYLKKPEILVKLLELLAYQVGNEVSYNELAIKLETSRETVIRYINLLEKAFVLFRLTPFSRNLRNEIGRKNKIYFYDLGVRNALINSFGDLENRTDEGALWENFCILERQKLMQEKKWYRNIYFWRTQRGKEIDYIEDYDGRLYGYEFKWGMKTYKTPKEFLDEYTNSSVVVINQSNYKEFLL